MCHVAFYCPVRRLYFGFRLRVMHVSDSVPFFGSVVSLHRQQKPPPHAGVDFEQSHTFFSRKHLSPRAETKCFSCCLTPSNFQPNLFALIPSPFCAARTYCKQLPAFYISVGAFGHAKRVVFLKERRGRSLLNFFGRKPLLVRNNKLHHPGAYSHTGCCATEITGRPDWISYPFERPATK